MPPRRFKTGEKVMAKWPGSNLWFPATVNASVGSKYEVKFEDGSDFEVEAKCVNAEVSFRPRSRSRSKSPARRTRRSRSPARRSPSPARRTGSPGRGRPRIEKKKEVVVTSTPKETVTKTVITESMSTRTYATRSATKRGEKLLELPVEVKSGRVPKTTELEYGGNLGCLITMLFYIVLPYYMYFACTAKSCSLLAKPVFSTNLSDYFDKEVSLQYVGAILLLAILSYLPFGQTFEGAPVRSGSKLKYRKNGLLTLIITLGIYGVLVHRKHPASRIGYDHLLHLLSASTVLSLLLSILLYVKSRKAPGTALAPQGNSGKVVHDFFVGHELHPRLGASFDFKMFIYRASIIQTALLTLMNVGTMCSKSEASSAIVLAALFQGWYILDSLWFEDRVVYTNYCQEYGCGFDMVFGCLTMFPLCMGFTTRYLVLNSTELSNVKIAAIVLFQLIAMVVYRGSNSQKWEFRRNPYNPKLAHLESVPTAAGTRLLVSGWWGLVRHPNYLGDILLMIGWSLPCGCQHALVWLFPVFGILFTVFQERSDFRRCKKKYGIAWNRYCQRVKYRLIPYVY
ncbi:delta(14)-sterol reductase TM7SF2-like [Glandiceps talaboti]